MMRSVVYHPRVPLEVREAYRYYDETSHQVAERFWDELTEAIHHARLLPELHHFDSSGYRRANLNRFPYHFLFQVHPESIRIIVVRHNRRHPGYGTRRR